MRSHQKHLLAGVGLALLSILAVGCGKITGTDSKSAVEVAGTVYTSWPLDSDHPIGPVAGAIVSSSLDGATSTTDANGKFDLKTTTVLSGNCVPYTVTISSGGSVVFTLAAAWGASAVNEQIILFPPTTQTFTAGGC